MESGFRSFETLVDLKDQRNEFRLEFIPMSWNLCSAEFQLWTVDFVSEISFMFKEFDLYGIKLLIVYY